MIINNEHTIACTTIMLFVMIIRDRLATKRTGLKSTVINHDGQNFPIRVLSHCHNQVHYITPRVNEHNACKLGGRLGVSLTLG